MTKMNEQTDNILQEVLICSCDSAEHQMLFRAIDKEDKCIFVDFHLVKRSFWYRVKYGVKYIFGYKCKYGAFDEMILDDRHVGILTNVLYYLKFHK